MVEELQVASPYLSNLDNEFRRLLKDPHLALEGREIYEHRFIDLNQNRAMRFIPSVIKRRFPVIVDRNSAARYFEI